MAEGSKIWLNRPQEDSEHFAAELAYHHINSLVAPVLHVVRKPLLELPDKPDAMLLTSRHAAYALNELPAHWRRLPVYCVGAATARHAKEYRCSNVIPGTSDIMALVPKLITQMQATQTLLYLSGDETRADIPSLLMARGIHVQTSYVYGALAEESLPSTLIEAVKNQEISAVAFFSPRSAATACRLFKAAGLADAAASITAYCLSLNVAREAGVLPWHSLMTCHTPTRRAMREMILAHRHKFL